jgi:GT2 family glycosyltransferase
VRALQAAGEAREVIVVDQSETRSTMEALRPLLRDERVRYVATGGRGVAAGRNDAIQLARGELVALTDDDCEPIPGWLEALVTTMGDEGGVGLVFGSVQAAAHDRTAGTIPAFVLEEAFVARGPAARPLVRGLGPCLLLRRSVWRALSGFDEALGAGARFRAGELPDFALRAIRAGYWVAGTPRAHVIHHGFRTWPEAAALLDAYCFGGGALWAKHLRWRATGTARAFLRVGRGWALGHSRVAASLGRRTARGRRLVWFARGFLAGACTPIDRATGHYATRRS